MARRCIECPETVIKDVQDANRVFPTEENKVFPAEKRTWRDLKESRQRRKNLSILRSVVNCIFFFTSREVKKAEMQERMNWSIYLYLHSSVKRKQKSDEWADIRLIRACLPDNLGHAIDDGDNSEDGGDSDSGDEEEEDMDILLDIIINPGLSVGQS